MHSHKNKNATAQGWLHEHKLNGCPFLRNVVLCFVFFCLLVFSGFFIRLWESLLILYYFICNLTRIKMHVINKVTR